MTEVAYYCLQSEYGGLKRDQVNSPEFIARSVLDWIAAVGSEIAYIEPGSPWENGYCESFNAKLRDELLNGEVFYTLKVRKSATPNTLMRRAGRRQCLIGLRYRHPHAHAHEQLAGHAARGLPLPRADD